MIKHFSKAQAMRVVLSSLVFMLTACAPASECELGENADGTCRLFQLDVLRVEPFGERFHEDGRGARFVSTRSIGSATSFGTESDSYTPVVKPGMAGVVLFSDVDGNLESAFDVPMGNLAQWGVYYSANEYLRSQVLRDGSLLLQGTTGASNWDELQNEPVDGRSTTYNNQHLTVIERDGSIRFHRLLGFGDIEYRDVLELDSAILIVGSVEKESTFRSAFLGDRNVPEFSFQESTSFFALFDKLTGQMLKVVLFDGFGARAVRLTHDGGIGINYLGLQNTQAKVWMPSGEELVLNPNSSAEIGGVLFLTAELVPDWHAPFKVVDSGLYEEHRIETDSAIFYSGHGFMSYPDNRFEVIVPPGATFLDLNATVERHVFITDRLGVDYAPEGFLGRQAISLGDGTKVRYAYVGELPSEALLAYLGLTAEDYQDVVERFDGRSTFSLHLRTNSDGQLLAFDFCRGDFLDGFESYQGWEIGFSRSFGNSVIDAAWMSNTLKGSFRCYYAGDFLNETAYRQFDGLDPEVRSSVPVQVRYRFY